MFMKIEHLQALRIVLRQELSGLYQSLDIAKENRRAGEETDLQYVEYLWHNYINKLKPKIAKLVEIQKSVKADIKKEISWQRQVRKATLMKQSAMENCGEAW
jgi:hypothetical protein